MNAQAYFQHARTLGNFSAVDCLALAREAAALDAKFAAIHATPPALVAQETLADGSNPVRLSFSIKTF